MIDRTKDLPREMTVWRKYSATKDEFYVHFIFHDGGCIADTGGGEYTRFDHCEELPPLHAMRPMTRHEAIEKAIYTPGMVVSNGGDWRPAHFFGYYKGDITGMRWAILKDGKVSEPHKFEVPDDA